MKPPAVLFHTCLVNEFCPEIGFAVVNVLERLGYAVHVPADQTCCGQPAFNAGFQHDARAAARHTITILERCDGVIVVPSGSCGDMMRHQSRTIFSADREWLARAERVAARVVEFSVLVHRHLDRLQLRPVQARVAYHPSCHLLRGLGIDREPRAVLDAIAGVERCAMDAEDECCGFGGLFSVKHPGISARMLERKLQSLARSGAERLVSCDLGCLLQIGGGLQRCGATTRTQHLAQLIEEALE